jgi:dihydrolipoamide dehydrogenase
MTKNTYDIIIIGSGPGGYVAAIEAAKKGKKVALIEGDDLGGTCLNRGCIPTKALLSRAEVLSLVKRSSEFGIKIPSYKIDFKKMQKGASETVSFIRKNLESLLLSHGVSIVYGFGKFISPKEIRVKGTEKALVLKAEKIIIATGSEPLEIPTFPFDHKNILSSTSILALKSLPKSLAIIGGGYIGCEFASLFAELGVKVHIIEAMDNILLQQDPAIRKVLEKKLLKEGVEIHTQAKVNKITKAKTGLSLSLANKKTLKAEKALVAIGRKLNSDALDLSNAGLCPAKQGAYIEVNEYMQTHVDHIYAIGDVTGKALLAHVASHQGIIAAQNACGQKHKMDYSAVPAVVFTHPEIATVGLNLEEAKLTCPAAKIGAFPFQALGKAQAALEIEGFAQIVFNPDSMEILGAQIVGPDAGNLISPMALAIQNEITLDCIQETIHAHPTLAEVWLEAAYMAVDSPIHLPPKRR